MAEDPKRQHTTKQFERMSMVFMALFILLLLSEHLLKRAGYAWEYDPRMKTAAYLTGMVCYGAAIFHRLRLFPFRK